MHTDLKPRRHDIGFETFVAGYSIRLLRAAYLLTGDHALAEDLLQMTLMRTARRWPSAKSAPEAYARKVLVNLSRDQHRRRRSRVREEPLPELGPELFAAGDLADAVVGRDEVIAAIAELPARQREVLVLRFYADLSVAQTASAMGASEGTVKSYTSRALDRMRELLAEPNNIAAQPAVEVPE